MKRIKYILVLLIVLLTTGFTNYDVSMNVEKNKEMDFTISILSDSLDEIESTLSLLNERYGSHGYEITRNDVDNKYGIKIYKHYDNIDNISFGKREEEFNLLYLHAGEFNNEIESKMFNVDKQFDTNRYAANFYVDISNSGINLNNASITYTVTLPSGTVSNNANSVNEEGNVLSWNIGSSKTEIDFVFELKSYDTIYYIVAIVIAIFLVFSIISNIFSKGGDTKENSNTDYKRGNYGPTDIDRKIQNFTQNSLNKNTNNMNVKEVSTNQNNVRNTNPNTNVNPNNVGNTNPNNGINTNINTNALVAGIPIIKPTENSNVTNSDLSEPKKQGIFDKLKKEDKSIGTLYDTNTVPTNEEFNSMINSMSNTSNTVNTNNMVNTGNTSNTNDIANVNNTENVSDTENVGNIDNINTSNVIDSKNNETEANLNNIPTAPIVKNDSKLDINNNSGHTLNDMFEYTESVKQEEAKEEVKEETEVKSGPVIKFNNKEIVISKNDEEE